MAVGITRVGGGRVAVADSVSHGSVGANRIGGGRASMAKATKTGSTAMLRMNVFVAGMGLVCGTNLGTGTVLWASDALLLTVNNGKLYVTEQ